MKGLPGRGAAASPRGPARSWTGACAAASGTAAPSSACARRCTPRCRCRAAVPTTQVSTEEQETRAVISTHSLNQSNHHTINLGFSFCSVTELHKTILWPVDQIQSSESFPPSNHYIRVFLKHKTQNPVILILPAYLKKKTKTLCVTLA